MDITKPTFLAQLQNYYSAVFYLIKIELNFYSSINNIHNNKKTITQPPSTTPPPSVLYKEKNKLNGRYSMFIFVFIIVTFWHQNKASYSFQILPIKFPEPVKNLKTGALIGQKLKKRMFLISALKLYYVRCFCFGSIKNKISVQNLYKSGKSVCVWSCRSFSSFCWPSVPVIESSTPLTLILSKSVSAVLLVAR